MAITEKMMFIDTSKCIACKACQVACKQWHSLPADTTSFTGSYQNPPAFSENNLTYVKFTEHVDYYGKLRWLFFKNQCRHCLRPKCSQRNPKGVKRLKTGAVIFNTACTWENVRLLNKDERNEYKLFGDDTEKQKEYKIGLFEKSCPFLVPRYSENLQTFVKCDLCFDRINSGKTTACELTCPVGAIQTGAPKDMAKAATARFRKVKADYPEACLHNGGFGKTNVVFLLTESPGNYDYTPARGL